MVRVLAYFPVRRPRALPRRALGATDAVALPRPLSVNKDALSVTGATNAMTVTCTVRLTGGEGTSALEGALEPPSAAPSPSRAPAGGATAPRPKSRLGSARCLLYCGRGVPGQGPFSDAIRTCLPSTSASSSSLSSMVSMLPLPHDDPLLAARLGGVRSASVLA